MNREEIMNILPHRDGMLLLDRAWLDADGTACAEYTVRGDEWFLRGHFPGNPVTPGVVLCEIAAQAACVLIQEEIQGKTPYYAGIDKVRFRRMVRPGDTLAIRAKLMRSKLNVFVVSAEGSVDGEKAVSGELSFILT